MGALGSLFDGSGGFPLAGARRMGRDAGHKVHSAAYHKSERRKAEQ